MPKDSHSSQTSGAFDNVVLLAHSSLCQVCCSDAGKIYIFLSDMGMMYLITQPILIHRDQNIMPAPTNTHDVLKAQIDLQPFLTMKQLSEAQETFIPTSTDPRFDDHKSTLSARKHMIPRGTDGLSVEGINAQANAAAVSFINDLPKLPRVTPNDLLDAYKKWIDFVIVSTKERETENRDLGAQPELSCGKFEIFWVAGQTEDGKHFIAKSQKKFRTGEYVVWSSSKWGLVSKGDFDIAKLDLASGSWQMARPQVEEA